MDFILSRYTFSCFCFILFCTKHRWGDICPCESRNGETIPITLGKNAIRKDCFVELAPPRNDKLPCVSSGYLELVL